MIAAAEGLAGKPPAGAAPDARFLQAWCRLEAFAKAQGLGIGRNAVRPRPAQRTAAPRPAEIEVAVAYAARAAGLMCAICRSPRPLCGHRPCATPPACGRRRFPPTARPSSAC
jgi:hypothetical protein